MRSTAHRLQSSFSYRLAFQQQPHKHNFARLSYHYNIRHRVSTILFQNMGFADDTNIQSDDSNDDALKWEKMYYSSSNQIDQKQQQSSISTTDSLKSEIRVVTFDLDNTIWKTMATISDANDVLASHLKEKFSIGIRSEKMMGKLFKECPDKYAGVDFADTSIDSPQKEVVDNDNLADIVQNVGQTDTQQTDDDNDGVHIQNKAKKKPVYLTLLRKDAIRILLQESKTDLSSIELEQQVDAAFEIWVEARCQSISNNFAPTAVQTLKELKSKFDYIGAITDGNSNPNRVAELEGIFDFVIRAEDVGVSKPDKRVFKAAVAALMLRLGQDRRSIEEFFLGESFEEGIATDSTYMASETEITASTPHWKLIDQDSVEAFSEAIGPWWVHIGDDFFKDVVAAKESQMRTVWARELIGGSVNDKRDNGSKEGTEKKQQQRDVNDLLNDVSNSDKGVLKMAIGGSDFLSESLHDEFSDAILDRFDELSGLLTKWHNEGKGTTTSTHEDAVKVNEVEINRQPDVSVSSEENDKSHKFCVFCGERLPIAATFCSSCGEKQI